MKTSLLLLLALSSGASAAGDPAAQLEDRRAIERVYYEHRLGQKPPFEETMPPAVLERLVGQDVRKERVLEQIYGVTIAADLLEAEVRRINATTRAPEMLAQIKTALGDDPARYARAFVKPILVEKLLRHEFENDDALHAPQRAAAETLRNQALAAGEIENRTALFKKTEAGEFAETIWQLAPRPVSEHTPAAEPPLPPARGSARSVSYSVEATAQLSQALAAPDSPESDPLYFEDLHPELRNVLLAQLREPGDVSAVIETPSAFLLFLTRERTAESFSVVSVTIPKRAYEEWLASFIPAE